MLVTIPGITAALLIQSYLERRSVSRAELKASIDAIAKEVELRGFHVDKFAKDLSNEAFIARAIKPLEVAIVETESKVCQANPRYRDACSFYQLSIQGNSAFHGVLVSHQRNQMHHVFALDAVVLLAVKELGRAAPIEEIYDGAKFLVNLFYYEFVLRTKSNKALELMIDQSLKRLESAGIIAIADRGLISYVSHGQGVLLAQFLLGLLAYLLQAAWFTLKAIINEPKQAMGSLIKSTCQLQVELAALPFNPARPVLSECQSAGMLK